MCYKSRRGHVILQAYVVLSLHILACLCTRNARELAGTSCPRPRARVPATRAPDRIPTYVYVCARVSTSYSRARTCRWDHHRRVAPGYYARCPAGGKHIPFVYALRVGGLGKPGLGFSVVPIMGYPISWGVPIIGNNRETGPGFPRLPTSMATQNWGSL